MNISRLALVTNGIYPNVIGGMERHSYYLCKYLAKKGIEVDLYHTTQRTVILANEKSIFEEDELKNISSFYLAYPKKYSYPGHYLREQRKYSLKILEAIIQRPDVDFIYTKGLSGYELIKHKKRGLPLPPIGVKVHGYEMYQPTHSWKLKAQHRLLRPAFKYVTVNADYVFSYGAKISDIVLKLGVPSERIIELPTGINENWLLDEPNKQEGVRSFVFLGRYEKRKGIEELQRAVMEVSKTHLFKFHFIGNIPPKMHLNLPTVHYHGIIRDDKKLKEIIRQSDVLVCPSHAEGMPNVIMEGMASGCAVIATDVGAVSLMVDEQNGWLIPPFNYSILKQTLIDAIDMGGSELQQKRTQSLEKVKHQFLWDIVSDRTIKKISQAIKLQTALKVQEKSHNKHLEDEEDIQNIAPFSL